MGYQMPNDDASKGQSLVTGATLHTKRNGIIGVENHTVHMANAHRKTN
jgi:hypothetical protein